MGTGNLAESSSRSAAKLVAFDSRPRNFSKRYKSLVGHHCRQGTLTIEFTLAQPSYNNGSAGMTTLSNSEIGDIVETVIHCDQLKLPARLSRAPLSSVDRRQYLLALLQHDAGVFLERHGRLIDSKQRAYFQPLAAESYEVDFYLKLLEDEELNSTNQEQAPSSTVKNRRLAKMTRLAKEGYFDDDAARLRAPLLHYQYIGQHTANSQPKSRANTLHDQIMQQHEEQLLRAKMAAQLREEEAAGEAFEATLSESDSDSNLEEAEDGSGGDDIQIVAKEGFDEQEATVRLSEEELQQNREDFRSIMEARFLNGEDGGKEADQDASLDNHWAKEQAQDMEDKYFET